LPRDWYCTNELLIDEGPEPIRAFHFFGYRCAAR
jgi:hypothetical protein